MTIFIACFTCLGVGYAIGLLQNGININIAHKHEQQPQPEKKQPEYNESLAGLLPAEVQEYYTKTNGQNMF